MTLTRYNQKMWCKKINIENSELRLFIAQMSNNRCNNISLLIKKIINDKLALNHCRFKKINHIYTRFNQIIIND